MGFGTGTWTRCRLSVVYSTMNKLPMEDCSLRLK
jgi:hypothetical protein